MTPAPLEVAILRAILALHPDDADIFARQVANASVSSRHNSGAGFFADLDVPRSLPAFPRPNWETETVQTVIDTTEHHCFVFIRDGYLSFIEGYTFDGVDTKPIDFTTAPFTPPTYISYEKL